MKLPQLPNWVLSKSDSPVQTLGLLDAQTAPSGMAKIRFLTGVVANQHCYSIGDEALVLSEDAALLRSGGRVECLTLLPAPKRDPHAFRDMELARLRRRAESIRRGLNGLSEWIMKPLGRTSFGDA